MLKIKKEGVDWGVNYSGAFTLLQLRVCQHFPFIFYLFEGKLNHKNSLGSET